MATSVDTQAQTHPPVVTSLNFIEAGGEMGALMRSIDWSQSSLGALESWPQSLRTSVSTMLRSPYPIILFWGNELRMLYNDPFRPILGAKHPATMGARGHEALAEEWTLLGPLMARVHETGEPLYVENGNVNFARRPGGLREEAYFTWSYNPTIGEQGEIAGLFAIASETTRQVVGDRRMAILRELSIRTALDTRFDHVFQALETVLGNAGHDVPFALFYAVENEQARLVSCVGLTSGADNAPCEITRDSEHTWPVHGVARAGSEHLLEDLAIRFGRLPGGPWPEPATRAWLLPVPMAADGSAQGVLVVGLSPLSAFDDAYRGFLQLLARQLTASIGSARAYEQERQRAEALAQLDRAKTEFFNNISHELRTPLTLIVGPVEDAMQCAEQRLEGEKLTLVRRNALRLLKMVNTLLDFSRLEAGRADARLVATDLASVTANLASQFRSATDSAGLALEIDCAALPEPVFVDPEMWEKIVLNLLSNAVKYTHHGRITVTLRWLDGEAVLDISDTGVGIPSDDLPHVFERFYRVRATEGRSHEGTGIGLALVAELVQLHGGRVSVSSTFARGSNFRVCLPRGSRQRAGIVLETSPRVERPSSRADAFADEARRWSEPDGHGAQNPHGAEHAQLSASSELIRARVLVVDDNADLRTYVASMLADVFSHVHTAVDGIDAWAQIQSHPPDLVLSDVMLPRLDGLGLVRAMREHTSTRAIPVILLSARAGEAPTVDGLTVGADDYLSKPFSARELLARVRTQLAMARVRRDAARDLRTKEELKSELEARDEWLRIVSHELRTPLSAASLSVQALLDTVPEAPSRAAAAVTRSFQRLEQQVEYLTDVAELATQRVLLTRSMVDVSALVMEAVAAARVQATRARCTLTVHVDEDVVGLFDARRLRQMVDHALDNAFKFGAGNAVEVCVERAPEAVSVSVIDHGVGISEASEERIFERFQRNTSAARHAGFGLGLWVAQRIAHAHGGSIDLRTTAGGGATFSARLPLSASNGARV